MNDATLEMAPACGVVAAGSGAGRRQPTVRQRRSLRVRPRHSSGTQFWPMAHPVRLRTVGSHECAL